MAHGTVMFSKRYKFERDMGLFPAAFSNGGTLMVDIYLGDYPRDLDGKRELTGMNHAVASQAYHGVIHAAAQC